eukprot:3349374-Rhodomonas_salina.1
MCCGTQASTAGWKRAGGQRREWAGRDQGCREADGAWCTRYALLPYAHVPYCPPTTRPRALLPYAHAPYCHTPPPGTDIRGTDAYCSTRAAGRARH